jgi:hypothetical protein
VCGVTPSTPRTVPSCVAKCVRNSLIASKASAGADEPRVVVEGVEHQRHVRPQRFTHGGASSQVALDAGCAWQRRLTIVLA